VILKLQEGNCNRFLNTIIQLVSIFIYIRADSVA